MKQITAYIQPHMESRVVQALHELGEFPGFTIADARGQGRGRGAGGHFVPTVENFTYHRRSVLTVICADALADQVCRVIGENARTGRKGDGLITVSDLGQVVRIRDGRSPDAVGEG
jgi:nitrogen regulatory protein PII